MRTIKLKKNYIEIPIVNDEGRAVEIFKFEVTDNALKDMQKRTEEVSQNASKNSFKSEEEARSFIKKCIDLTFGEGSFERLYTLNPSLTIVSAYFMQLCLIVKEELQALQMNKIQEKYLEG